jgi:anti-sigma regulatory factor (Ser/Thr protein kinase)
MKIKSKVENLRLVEKFVDDISEGLLLHEDIYGNVLIATLEAVNNAIVHGNKKNEKLDVDIEFITIKDDLMLIVEDQGKGFDYKNIPDPTSPENIEKINGRGVFLMEKLSDHIEFENNGSKVKLTFTDSIH